MKKYLAFLIFLPFFSNAQIINTIAGNGSSFSSGDGGAATTAGIYGPNGVVFDKLGNLYITEYYSNTIRKVTPAGIISTIAGTGIAGYSGDGGPATNAQLSKPVKIAIDTLNNLYFADLNNNSIRKITPTGVITTVAGIGIAGYSGDGGLATASRLFHPSGVSCDRMGNIYIADYGNSVIRKVSSVGIITTIAGTGVAGSSGDGGPATAAQLNQPWGVTPDGTGNLYIADLVNHKVRKISSSGTITTFAGTGVAGFAGDGGAAISAMLNQPACVIFDQSGNMYISDQLNNRIRKISTSGIISTIAGNGIAGYSGDGGPATAAAINSTNDIAFDTLGRLVICDNTNNRVRRISNCVAAITTHPLHDTVPEGTNAIYTVTTSMPMPTYQWQQNPGAGFVNLANVWPYSGVTTNTLTIHNTSYFLNTTHYRCVISNGGCTDTSTQAILIVNTPTSVRIINTDNLTIYPNPAHNNITIVIPDGSRYATVQLLNEMGQVISEQNAVPGSTNLNIADLPSAMYILRLQSSGQTVYKKFFKN